MDDYFLYVIFCPLTSTLGAGQKLQEDLEKTQGLWPTLNYFQIWPSTLIGILSVAYIIIEHVYCVDNCYQRMNTSRHADVSDQI